MSTVSNRRKLNNFLLFQVLDAKIEDLSDRLRLGMATMQVGELIFCKQFIFILGKYFYVKNPYLLGSIWRAQGRREGGRYSNGGKL
jgi:hypothetical protein